MKNHPRMETSSKHKLHIPTYTPSSIYPCHHSKLFLIVINCPYISNSNIFWIQNNENVSRIENIFLFYFIQKLEMNEFLMHYQQCVYEQRASQDHLCSALIVCETMYAAVWWHKIKLNVHWLIVAIQRTVLNEIIMLLYRLYYVDLSQLLQTK